MAAATASFLAFSPNTNFTRRYGINKAPTVAAVQSRVSVFANPNPNLRNRGFFAFGNRIGQRICLVVAAFDESKDKDIEVEKERDELKTEANEAQEAWKETLESFKVEALKMKEVSQEAYEVYSKKAMVILEKTSKTLKIQADKAKEDLSVVAKQISEEGNVYLSAAAENSPESIKDVVETFAASTDELKEMSAVRDYHLGIPYGAFLSVGGFLMFMLTGSIAAIRFGVILGGALLAMSVESLRSSKRGESSELFLKGQTAIATILFLKKWRDFCQHQLFSTALLALVVEEWLLSMSIESQWTVAAKVQVQNRVNQYKNQNLGGYWELFSIFIQSSKVETLHKNHSEVVEYISEVIELVEVKGFVPP